MHNVPHRRVVVHVCSGDLWGGAEAMVRDLIVAQAREGSFAPHCAVLNDGHLAQALRDAGIPVLQLDESRMGFGELLRQLIAYCRVTRPMVIHSHRVKEHMLGGLARTALAFKGIYSTAVGTVHGRPEILRNGRKLRDAVVRGAERFALALLLRRVALVSRDMEHSAARDLWPARGVVVHNGLDADRVRMEASGDRDLLRRQRPANEIQLIAAGRLVPVKRFDRLADIATELHRASGRPVRVLLLGDGPLAAALRRQFATLPSGVSIEMRGFVQNVPTLVAASDGLLMPSDHEGLPVAALEAAALGVPVFAFAVGGLPEVIENGGKGFLAPAGDCAALGRGIAGQLQRRAQEGCDARGSSPGARDWHFSIDACRRRYEALYESALGGGVRREPMTSP